MRLFAWAISLAAIALFVVGYALELHWLRLVAKPVPVLVLAAWVLRGASGGHARLVGAGLVLSALGDVLLEVAPSWFVFGLGAFLLAHVAYVASFTLDAPALAPLRALPFAFYGVGMLAILWPDLGDMAAPVALYTLAICTMLWRAAARVGSRGAALPLEWIGVAGATSFALSDSLIALSRFHAPIEGVRAPILALYWAGQYGIARSVRGLAR